MFLEQLMSTGGGWQDQIGGVVNGIKLITSNSGMQKLKIRNVELKKQTFDKSCSSVGLTIPIAIMCVHKSSL